MAVGSLQKQPGEAAGDRLPSLRDKGVDAPIKSAQDEWLDACEFPTGYPCKEISPDSPARKRESICIIGARIPRNEDFPGQLQNSGNCRWRGASWRRLGQDPRK